MTDSTREIVILGATGSIGRSTLDVVRASAGQMRIAALTAHRQFDLLCQQAAEFQVPTVIATDPLAAKAFDWSRLPRTTELKIGPEHVATAVSLPQIDTVVTAVVGRAGLEGTWAAVQAGKRVALANKEALVVAGSLMMAQARTANALILPVDSEHSAIFQALRCGRREDLQRIILTASGGPFRRHTQEQLEQVTVAEALAHPTWQMGPKITIDSATMTNKALEIIEARWLFDLAPDQIEVVVHPQSIVHSLVEYVDGSVVAQMSPPDMRLPIQYALTYPARTVGPARKLQWQQPFTLEFEPPDEDRFPALRLGKEVAAAGGTTGAVFNAANETAVAAFLAGRIRLPQIAAACRAVLETHHFEPHPTLSQLLELDSWGRKETERWIGA